MLGKAGVYLCADGIKTHQITRQVKCSDLLIALLGDGITLNGSGADRVQRLQFIPALNSA